MTDNNEHTKSSEIYRLPIHYDVPEHTLSIDSAIQGLMSVRGVIRELEKQLIILGKNYQSPEIMISADEEGGLKQILYISRGLATLSAASLAFTLVVLEIEESENFAKFMQEIKGEEYENGQIDAFLGKVTTSFMEKDAEEFEQHAPGKINFNNANKPKSDFFNRCLMDANIKGLEFNDDDKFLIQRNDFPMKISRNLSKETESELKIYRDVTLVSAVEIDLNRVWCFQDSFSKKDINAYMEDEEFKESFFKGHYPLKTSFHDDKVTILIEAITDVEGGIKTKKTRFNVTKVCKFNDIDIAPIPSSVDKYNPDLN